MKINGSLVFDASSASEIQNLRVQKYANFAAVPAHTAADSGRMVYAVDAAVLYYGTATAWLALATGGNAAALQTEVDAIETTIGALIDQNGVFVPGQVTGLAFSGSETTITQLLQALSDYANANNTLAELDDVTLTSLATGDYLKYNGAAWVNDTLLLNDVTDVTALVADVNLLGGAAAGTGSFVAGALTAAQLSFLGGATPVTSSVQLQLNNRQPLDAGLTSLSAVATAGFLTVDATGDIVTSRTLVAPAAGITITNVDGSGNPVFALANDLAALEGLGTVGYIVRTADGSAATRVFSTIAADIVITGDANGVSTDTTFGLAPVTQATTGDFVKVSLDTKGRVVGNTAVLTADITALVDGTYVNVTGDTMTGNLVMSGALTKITLPNTPLLDTDAVNKAYVDALTAGLSWKPAVRAASTVNLTLSGEQTVDGVALVAGNRVLVKNQTAPAENGIYVVAGGAWTRAGDMDAAAEFDGSAVFVQEGSQEGQGFTETATVVTVGTDAVAFSQFSGGQAFVFGVGLSNSANVINVNMGAGIAQLPSDEVGLDIVANQAIQLTSLLTDGQLTLVLAAGSGLAQTSAGLTINAASVTNAMLVNPAFTINADTGTDSLPLGDTLEIRGVATQGIVTSVVESGTGSPFTSTFTVTASNATASQRGVATFNTASFDASAGGDITIKTAGVTNLQMVNSVVTFAGTAGTPDAVALGETLTLSSTVAGLVSSTVSANAIALDVRLATDVLTGVASFAAADFTVAAGAVSLVAKGLTSLTDVTVASAEEGQVLVKTAGAGDFTNQHIYAHYDGVTDGGATAKTAHTFTHNIGQKFLTVTVLDDTDNVVIPQSIVFNNANELTVTFNTAIKCHIVAMGVAGGKKVTITN